MEDHKLSLNNKLCFARPTLLYFNINPNKCNYYPCVISADKCDRRYNATEDPYVGNVCCPEEVNNINVRVFNLILWINELTFLVWLNLCECKCRLKKNLSNLKQRWNRRESVDVNKRDKFIGVLVKRVDVKF